MTERDSDKLIYKEDWDKAWDELTLFLEQKGLVVA
jgi:hypothetical protein